MVAWIVLILAIALGAAGLATATPSSVLPAARPELTGVVDAQVMRQLDTVQADLSALAADVDALGTQGRGALSALVGGRQATVDAAVAAGDALLVKIGAEATAIRARMKAAPYVGGPAADLHVSPAVQARYARLLGGLDAVTDLDASWAGLTSGAVIAAKVSASLAEHDRLVGLAAESGRAARYKEAVTHLAEAGSQLEIARTLRTELAKTVDVSVLDQWLERNTTYDKALRNLYIAVNKVGGRVTKAVRDAIAAEKEARRRLPPDSRGLIVIIAEIGRGGMNSAVITIEEAKATLADALAPAPSASPSAEPSATP
jgi:hypothetical protein